MNEEQTTVETSPEESFGQALAQVPGIDTTGYKFQPKSDDNTTEKIDNQERGTDEPELASTEVSNEATDKSNATSSQAEGKQVKGKNRSQDRIQELLTKNKEYEAKLAEFEKAKASPSAPQTAQEAPKTVETPTMVQKPEYSADVLKGLLKKKQFELDEHIVNGDLPNIRATRELMESIQEKLQDAVTWETRNKSAVEKYNSDMSNMRAAVLKDFPDMGTENSPIRQAHGKVYQRFLEIQKNPALLEYELASIASLRTKVGAHASEKAALETQVKQLQQENASLKGKAKPLSQDEATTSGESSKDEDPRTEFRRGLKTVLATPGRW